MNNLQPFYIAGYNAGLQTDKKPFLLPEQAFPVLENAYVWRERVKKREGLKLLARLRRVSVSLIQAQTTGAAQYTSADVLSSVRATEPNAEIEAESVVITIAPAIPAETTVYNDVGGTGVLNYVSGPYTISSGTINYATGEVVLNFTVVPPAARNVVVSLNYFPSLPVMGIYQRDIANLNDEETIFFDTKYAYVNIAGSFQEFILGTTWNGTDSDLFWCTNYRGTNPEDRLFFATNFVNTSANPIRYTDGTTWTTFSPLVDATHNLYQARIIIPYYGRLLALNVYEGTTAGSYAGAVNIFNRCRFSQIGDPTAADAWRSDQFGKGGFIDAPTNEAIISATFFKNTLIVFFERSTWQLRYVGEYGLPFIWERISSDFGSESTLSYVLFDGGVLGVGDKGIVTASATDVSRIDLQIPDTVFTFKNATEGVKRVTGVRDFQRELVFWNYVDSEYGESTQVFPNKVLVYNYRNNTYAIFRDNITVFGTFQPTTGVSWNSLTIYWNDPNVLWNDVDTQSQFPFIVSGNQQGFIHYYGSLDQQDEASLAITSIDLTVSPIQLTIPNHNLVDGEIVYLTGLLFLSSGSPVSTDLNDQIYRVSYIDADTVALSEWDGNQYIDNFSFTPNPATSTYVGGGRIALFPRLNVQTKDFNPYQVKGGQIKLSYVDFLTDATPSAVMSVTLYANTSPAVVGNLLVGNTQVETYLTHPYYTTTVNNDPICDIAWHRFYATLAAQYIRIAMTYDESLMNTLSTHQQSWILNAITLWVRPGGKIIF
jgi:hypothetical protein